MNINKTMYFTPSQYESTSQFIWRVIRTVGGNDSATNFNNIKPNKKITFCVFEKGTQQCLYHNKGSVHPYKRMAEFVRGNKPEGQLTLEKYGKTEFIILVLEWE